MTINDAGLLLMIAGVVLMMLGYARISRVNFPCCAGCKLPMPDGFTGQRDGENYCKACCRKTGIPPWWWREQFGDPWQ